MIQELAAVTPAVEVNELKRARHLPLDDQADDDSLSAYLLAAQSVVETACAQLMSERPVAIFVAGQPGCKWFLPMRPVRAVDAIAWQDDAGLWQELDPAAFPVLSGVREPYIVMSDAALMGVPAGAELRVSVTAGYDDVGLNAQMRQAVILLAGEWMEAGIAFDEIALPECAFAAQNLIRQVRYRRRIEWEVIG